MNVLTLLKMSKNKTLFGENVNTVECHRCKKEIITDKAKKVRVPLNLGRVPICEQCYAGPAVRDGYQLEG